MEERAKPDTPIDDHDHRRSSAIASAAEIPSGQYLLAFFANFRRRSQRSSTDTFHSLGTTGLAGTMRAKTSPRNVSSIVSWSSRTRRAISLVCSLSSLMLTLLIDDHLAFSACRMSPHEYSHRTIGDSCQVTAADTREWWIRPSVPAPVPGS